MDASRRGNEGQLDLGTITTVIALHATDTVTVSGGPLDSHSKLMLDQLKLIQSVQRNLILIPVIHQ